MASLSEPSEEPPATAPTPHGAQAEQAATAPGQRPPLDSITAELYESVEGETFAQRRARLHRQETLSFAPMRSQRHTSHVEEAAPYEAHRPSLPAPPPSNEPVEGQVFYLEDLDNKMIPNGWHMDEHGYLQLSDKTTDFWELKSGCLLRHHVVPRRGRLHLDHLPKDCPVKPDQLDSVRVTLIHQNGGKSRLCTDDGYDSSPPPDVKNTWTGVTIFQLNGSVRKELSASMLPAS